MESCGPQVGHGILQTAEGGSDVGGSLHGWGGRREFGAGGPRGGDHHEFGAGGPREYAVGGHREFRAGVGGLVEEGSHVVGGPHGGPAEGAFELDVVVGPREYWMDVAGVLVGEHQDEGVPACEDGEGVGDPRDFSGGPRGSKVA